MRAFISSLGGLFRSGHWWLAVVLALGLSGCQSWDLDRYRGEGFPEDDMTNSVRKARAIEACNGTSDEENWFATEKARQIDRNLRRE